MGWWEACLLQREPLGLGLGVGQGLGLGLGRACCSVSRWTSWCRLWCARCGAAGLNSAHEAEAVGSYKLT